MGGSLAIQYAARNPRIAAVVADCAFSSLNDTVDTSVKFFTGLPPFPFAPMIVFWTEREAGFQASEIDAKQWIRQIAPRPIFLLQGGADVVVSRESGQRLFEAAGQPKELWYDAEVGHAQVPGQTAGRIRAACRGVLRQELEARAVGRQVQPVRRVRQVRGTHWRVHAFLFEEKLATDSAVLGPVVPVVQVVPIVPAP